MPSLREKKRFVVFEIISNNKFDEKQASDAINSQCLSFLGELGFSKAGIMFLPDKFKNNKGMIKVNNKYVNELKSCLALTKKINNEDVIVRSIGTSGIINKAEGKYMIKEEVN